MSGFKSYFPTAALYTPSKVGSLYKPSPVYP
jgi:hypothetical protein